MRRLLGAVMLIGLLAGCTQQSPHTPAPSTSADLVGAIVFLSADGTDE